jgi:20S proteasome subunit beta 1
VANRVSNKLTPVSESIYCCRSGSAADTQAISDYVRMYLDMHESELGRSADVLTAATLFAQMIYRNKEQLSAGIICGGWDRAHGGSVYNIPQGGALVRQPWAIGGSGSTYIWGWCDANYRDDMTREQCEQFVRTGLALAMARDGSSGGVIRTVTIDAAGVERKFVAGNMLPTFFTGEPMALNKDL